MTRRRGHDGKIRACAFRYCVARTSPQVATHTHNLDNIACTLTGAATRNDFCILIFGNCAVRHEKFIFGIGPSAELVNNVKEIEYTRRIIVDSLLSDCSSGRSRRSLIGIEHTSHC